MKNLKKHGILNSDISKVLADLGHTDQITIGDCGLPTPTGVPKIDLALKLSVPSFVDVLTEVLSNMAVEKVILAEEIKTNNETGLKEVLAILPEDVIVEYVTHENFKAQTSKSKVFVRTGEVTPFMNIVPQADMIF